jgi:hypothetical protein
VSYGQRKINFKSAPEFHENHIVSEAMIDMTHGQWIGFDTNNNGIETHIVLNVEKRFPNVSQVLSHVPQYPHLRTLATLEFPAFETEVLAYAKNVQFFEQNGALIPLEEYWAKNKITEPMSKQIRYTFLEKGRKLRGTYKGDTGITGVFELVNTIHDPVTAADKTLTWKEFKDFVASEYLEKQTIIFRGQPDNGCKLWTSFHRCGRNNLWAYLQEDVPNLRHAVNAISNFY